MRPQKDKPPKAVEYVFGWVCKPEILEEILGDLEEYYSSLAEQPKWRKRLYYWFHALHFIRPFAVKRLEGTYRLNHYGMFKNYFKTSLRNMLKNPMSSFINVFGLAVAIAVCLVVYSFLDNDYSIDEFHENRHKIYLATFFVDREGVEEQYGTSPAPLAGALAEDFSQITKTCRVDDRPVVIKYQDKVFQERVRYVDPEFLEMLTFPLKWGHKNSLEDRSSIVLSEAMSEKYFGSRDPIGKDLKLNFGKGRMKTFKVSGVAEAFPVAHAIEFDFLINFENFRVSHPAYDLHDWRNTIRATLVQVEHASDMVAVNAGMEKYKRLQNEVEFDWTISQFEWVRLADLHFKSRFIKQDISHDSFYEGRVILPFIAIFMLVLACLNYINIAIVSATKRLKEIALRKVIGANRAKVAIQFLSENILVTSFAMIVGFLLAITMFLPWFVKTSSMDLELDISDLRLWLFLGSMIFATGIVSGLYPALYVSKFQVTAIFRGGVKFGRKNLLTKVFLGMQLILACTGVTGAIMFAQNSAYQETRSWGYEQDQVIYTGLHDPSAYHQLHRVMSQNPNVLSLAGSRDHLGATSSDVVLHLPKRDYEVQKIGVEANYFETLGIKLKKGRFFKANHQSDDTKLIINERLADNLAFEEPIGQVFRIDSGRYEIIGVVQDFHFSNFYYDVRPVVFKVAQPDEFRFLSMKVKEGSDLDIYRDLQKQWSLIFPEEPFMGGLQQDIWGMFYEDLDIQRNFMGNIAAVAVLLASLGLYGLITLNVSGRVKEFSIRKTLGAQRKNIAKNIIRQYAWLTGIALVTGAPVGYYLNQANLDLLFAYPKPDNYFGAIAAAMILLAILVMVVLMQVRKIARTNPIDGLRVE
ncbi:MAG: ABC transporter permease [Cyclobacteriaceae bacterium]|nr:ABC transporter permease [Cyclobacteriaceae bacterium HetDA_MAG_MS6]